MRSPREAPDMMSGNRSPYLIFLALLLLLTPGCNLESPMTMLEHLEEARSALQATAGVETVSVNVRNTTMAVSAVDEKFQKIKEEDRQALAQNLATVALQRWPEEWPISEVHVYIAYPSGDYSTQGETYKFNPTELDLTSTPTPAASSTHLQ